MKITPFLFLVGLWASTVLSAGCAVNNQPGTQPPVATAGRSAESQPTPQAHLLQDQVSTTARQFVTAYNQAIQDRQSLNIAAMNNDYQRSQELIRSYGKNMETSKASYQILQEIAQNQGTGEITLFFSHNSSELPENSFQYNRLIRYLDSLERNNKKQGLVFVIMGSASANGEENHNMMLSQRRANAPIPIIDHYLVNVPHTYHKVYGTGETNSPQAQPEDINSRYRFVRIMALFSEFPVQDVHAAGDLMFSPMVETMQQVSPYTNLLGMTFIKVPAGSFMMGSPATEIRRDKNEILHPVTLTQSFYLQTTEVTQQQWIDVMGVNPSHFKNCGMDCPVENVSHSDAMAFIEKLNKMEQTIHYRLPTEAEWEYAARAGTTTAFFNGPMVHGRDYNTNPYLDRAGWYYWNAMQAPHQAALKDPNPWGFYDMHGNVWEWCSDWQRPYPFHADKDPKGAEFGEAKIRRGGSWAHYPEYCRSAYRSWYDPEDTNPEMGFRVAITRLEKKPIAVKAIPVQPPQPVVVPKPTPMTGPVTVPQCILIRDITFHLDTSQINPRMIPLMDRAVEILKQVDGKIELRGHTCSLGTKAYNMDLGLRRAASVRDYLVSGGIDPNRITIKSFGEEAPQFTNLTETGRALNRRVEIHVYSTSK